MITAFPAENTLPEVLTDYLCGLIASETETVDAALMGCKLEIGEMGGRPVQRIELCGKRYTVFGFPPVQCKILVLVSHGSCKLALTA